MKLEPGERSILASFAHGPDAESALKDLKAAGYTEVQMDRVGRFGFKPDVDMKRPAIAGNETSLANAVLNPAALNDESRVLMAAFPEASGMSGEFTMDDMPFLVTIVTNDRGVDGAVDIIKRHGGRV